MYSSRAGGAVAVCLLLAGCELQAPLRVEQWDLTRGKPGFIEAVFEIDRPVFREPLNSHKGEVGAVWVMPPEVERPLFGYPTDPAFPQVTDIQLLTDRRFRMTVDPVPVDLPPPPYVLWFGVRRGEGPSPGWPTIEGRVQFGTPLIE